MMKYTSIGNYDWDSNFNYIWESSSLNSFLNTEFYNTFDEIWKEKILFGDWKSNTISNLELNVKEYYNQEVLEGTSIYNGKIGLIYLNDYGYASAPKNWSISLATDSWKSFYKDNNWMFSYSGDYNWSTYVGEWTMSLFNYRDELVRPLSLIHGGANPNYGDWYPTSRPAFYLSSDVILESGDGTHDNPFRLEV